MAPPTMARFTMALFTKVLHGLDGRLEPPLMLPTPLGAVTLLWADEHGLACFHTAGDLSAGARVVLNSFWQTPAAAAPAPRSPSPPAKAPRDALPRREVPGAATPNPNPNPNPTPNHPPPYPIPLPLSRAWRRSRQ